jgi:hypothetical protein
MGISSHTTRERFPAVAPIARIPGASLFFLSPSRRRLRISAKVRPRPLIISCRNSKSSGEGSSVVVAETRCQHRRGRWPAAWLANSIGAPAPPAVVAHEAGRPDAEPATETQNDLLLTRETLLQIRCRCRQTSVIIGSTQRCSRRSGGGRVGAAGRVGQRMKPYQPAALVSCTVTLGAAKRISPAAKASISRRNAWRCR